MSWFSPVQGLWHCALLKKNNKVVYMRADYPACVFLWPVTWRSRHCSSSTRCILLLTVFRRTRRSYASHVLRSPRTVKPSDHYRSCCSFVYPSFWVSIENRWHWAIVLSQSQPVYQRVSRFVHSGWRQESALILDQRQHVDTDIMGKLSNSTWPHATL